jgi:hypothetical protein
LRTWSDAKTKKEKKKEKEKVKKVEKNWNNFFKKVIYQTFELKFCTKFCKTFVEKFTITYLEQITGTKILRQKLQNKKCRTILKKKFYQQA